MEGVRVGEGVRVEGEQLECIPIPKNQSGTPDGEGLKNCAKIATASQGDEGGGTERRESTLGHKAGLMSMENPRGGIPKSSQGPRTERGGG